MAGFGAKIKLEGESEFRSALKEINTNLKLVTSELKVTSQAFSNGDKSVKDARASYNSMNNTVDEQKKKIATLKDTVAEMTKKYGEDNEQVKVFKTQLNNAEAQLLKMDDATNKNTKELKDMAKNMDDAGTSGLKLGDIIKANLISEAVIGGVKALGSAFKGLATGIVNVGKEAIGSYADYQQLVGGVETLFKDSKDQVMQYAQNAYKTAGVSANDYMQGVTNFSASLIASVGGDTKKATEIANQTFMDMSDNVNKFGSDFGAVQSAFQGFSKQNYTMLDNLKLGYGGTKTEMQRLLADAQKITGIKYDISNLSDVYSAIHVIQQKLGVTGTTAKEAGTTISGSVNMMKASWQNLLTTLADPNGDMEASINALVESVFGDGTEENLGVFGNILPSIEAVGNALVEAIPTIVNQLTEHLPEFIEIGVNLITSFAGGLLDGLPAIIQAITPLINTFIQAIVGRLPELIQVAIQLVGTLANGIVQNLPAILNAGIQAIVELVKGLAEAMPTLIPQMVDTVLLIVDTLIDNIDLLVDAGIQLLTGIAKGLIDALPRLIEKIPILIDKLITSLTDNLPLLVEMGIKLTVELAIGLVKAIPQLVAKIPQIIGSIVSGFANGVSKMAEVGKNLIRGLWDGIGNMTNWLFDKIKGFKDAVLNKFKAFFGIHSPSRLFRDELGTNLALGLGEGFTDTMGDVAKDMANSIPTEFDSNLTTTINNPGTGIGGIGYENLVDAFKEALKDTKVVMDGKEMGTFVTNKIESVVYN